MNEQYYMVVDGKSVGPFTLEDLLNHPNLTDETLVWKPGLSEWIQAKTMPEFENKFRFIEPPIQDVNFAENPQYRQDHRYDNDYRRPDQMSGYYRRPNPMEDGYPHPNHMQGGYQRQNGYNNNIYDRSQPEHFNNEYRRPHTNWLAWAIVATVLGALTSCFGLIFGIIGIVQANKANRFYSQGLDREGDVANSSAKIMTIIGLVIAGLGLLGWIAYGSILAALLGNIDNIASYSI